MKIKFLLGSLGVVFSLILAGCGNPPQPCHVPINNKADNVSKYEKIELLSKILKKHSGGWYIKGNCIITNERDVLKDRVGYNFYYSHFENCFDISDSNMLTRTDNSHCYKNRKAIPCDYFNKENYVNYINKLQSQIIPQELSKEISLYSNYKQKYMKAYNITKEKIKSTQLKIVDPFNIVPKNIINEIKPQLTYNTYLLPLIKSYIKNKPIDFKIIATVSDHKSNRYFINCSNKREYNYKNIPRVIKFNIKEVGFNFIPNSFVAKDKNLKAKISYIENKNEFKIDFINNLKTFISIQKLVIYYGKNIYGNYIKSINLPPKSHTTIDLTDYTISNPYITLNNKSQKVNFGLSIGYKLIDENILKSIYKVKKFSIKDVD